MSSNEALAFLCTSLQGCDLSPQKAHPFIIKVLILFCMYHSGDTTPSLRRCRKRKQTEAPEGIFNLGCERWSGVEVSDYRGRSFEGEQKNGCF